MTTAAALISWLESGPRALKLAPFQRRFLRGAFAPRNREGLLSVPRGNGKSTLCGHVLAAALCPDGPLHRPGAESVLMAGSLHQARHVFAALRERLGIVRMHARNTDGYRLAESATSMHAIHIASGARVVVVSSAASTAFGLRDAALVVADEPGCWQERRGALMRDAVTTAAKGDHPLRSLWIGTLAPAGPGHFWPALMNPKRPAPVGAYREVLAADRAKWADPGEARRVNPLAPRCRELRRALRDDLANAKADPDARRKFLSFRLNVPTEAAEDVLLTVDDWARVLARPVPDAEGPPVCGLDLGGANSWSAAVLLWRNGRCEARAVAPGAETIEALEAADAVGRGTYAELVSAGVLRQDGGLHVPRVGTLVDAILDRARPALFVCDRFRRGEVADAVRAARVPVRDRQNTWRDASEDIRALRRAALDGNLAVVDDGSRELLALGLRQSRVEWDTSGNCRVSKVRGAVRSRDDVAVAGVLAAGARERWGGPRRARRVRAI